VPEADRITRVDPANIPAKTDWDETLEELRDDPEVTEAIAVIDSDPPPGPFVRSSPPPAADTPLASSPPATDYHEPPEVDPPPLTYAQVFEDEPPPPRPASPPAASDAGPRATTAQTRTQRIDSGNRFIWLAMLVLALFAIGYLSLTEPRPEAESDATIETESAAAKEAASGARAESEATTEAPSELIETTKSAAAAEPAPAAETATESEEAGEAAPQEPPIYAKTGAEDTYEAQLELGRRLKRGSRAAAAYRRAIELDPEGSDALAELARLQLGREHVREAAELAERASAIDPTNALAWVVLGAARQARSDLQGARQAYRNCVKLGKGRYVSECRAMLR
jgi:hypothetical protein